MALLRIRIYPDPALKENAEAVTNFSSEVQKLFDDMVETMFADDGVGLAAPQVGVSKNIIIAAPTMKKGEEYVIVNPEIYERQGHEWGVEGCLSFPGVTAEVKRAKKIRLRYQDRGGKAHDEEIKGFFARIIQHEADHLEGILLVDQIDFNKRQELLAAYQNVSSK